MMPLANIKIDTARISIPYGTEPFGSAEEAWFWTMGALRARRENTASQSRSVPRPCDPDDVIRCLDRLYRQRRITLEHARVMRIWGERQSPPHTGRFGLRGEAALWREAMLRLEFPLRMKGIVV